MAKVKFDPRDKQAIEEREKLINSLTPSPQARTDKVWKVIRQSFGEDQLTNWDVICFCVSYLASQVTILPWLKEIVLRLTQLHWQAHYYATEELALFGLNKEGKPRSEESFIKKQKHKK